MAKKVKRQTRRSEESPVLSTAPTSARTLEREFNPDYSPVIKDLKRIGALASTFFVVLILLSFFLR